MSSKRPGSTSITRLLSNAPGTRGPRRAGTARLEPAPAGQDQRRPEQITRFFDGLDLLEPGVVPCSW
jgi:hypothetical protein